MLILPQVLKIIMQEKNDIQHEMPISLEKKSRLLLNNRSFDYCLEQTFSYDPWGNLTYRDPLFLEVQLFLSNRLLIENIYLWVIHNWRHQFFQTFWVLNFSSDPYQSPHVTDFYTYMYIIDVPFKNGDVTYGYFVSFCSNFFLYLTAR